RRDRRKRASGVPPEERPCLLADAYKAFPGAKLGRILGGPQPRRVGGARFCAYLSPRGRYQRMGQPRTEGECRSESPTFLNISNLRARWVFSRHGLQGVCEAA